MVLTHGSVTSSRERAVEDLILEKKKKKNQIDTWNVEKFVRVHDVTRQYIQILYLHNIWRDIIWIFASAAKNCLQCNAVNVKLFSVLVKMKTLAVLQRLQYK